MCEEDERDRHAAFVARSDLLRTGDLAGDDRPHFEASCKLGNQFLTCGVPWYFSSKFLTIDAVVSGVAGGRAKPAGEEGGGGPFFPPGGGAGGVTLPRLGGA